MLQRIQFTVKNYKTLQGLATVMLGMTLLLETAWRAELLWRLFPQGLNEWGFFATILVGGIFMGDCASLALVYYRRTFGQINISQSNSPATAHVSGWIVLCAFLIIIGMGIDVNLHPHISFIVLAFAATLVVRWYCLGRTLHYYLVLAILLLAVSCLPILPFVYAVFVQSKSDQFSYLLGATTGSLLIVIGLCDHIALLHNMRKIRRLMLTNTPSQPNR